MSRPGHGICRSVPVLAEHLATMDDPGVWLEVFNGRDTAFPVAIAQAGGNPLVVEMTTALRNAMRVTLLERLQNEPDYRSVTMRLCREHHEIHHALLAGDGARAADLVEAPIDGFYNRRAPA